ncbi:MAG TPA: 3-keto-5-aminohexanoate cleavage protein [Methylomirabilota bacterium]|nr:3-keto-5-aminohexanoate cleavage protein [Methylomirabilota bacterium]
MKPSDNVIISCAITGSIHTPSMSPHLPVTPDEIADSAIGAAEAGAAILHLHARDPATGAPTPDPEVFLRFLPRIAAATDAVINITTGGGQTMTVDQRLAAAFRAEPEMCSLNLGSMNFGLYPMAEKPREWAHPWETEHLLGSKSFIFRNTFADIERILEEMGERRGARFEFEAYDTGHLYTLAHMRDRGLIKGRPFVQFVLGVLGGTGADPECLFQMKATADRLLGDDYDFSVAAAGRMQFRLVTMGAALGGHVRVGLEDNLYVARGRLATSNAEQVMRIREVLEALSFTIAGPDEARARLGLKGRDKVAF